MIVYNNLVKISKSQPGLPEFITKYLTKYEQVRKLDFYNSTKNHKSYKLVKEIRKLYSEDNNYIYFPRGIFTMIPNVESYYNVEYCTTSLLNKPEINKDDIRSIMSSFTLREDQVLAVVKCLVNQRGVVQLPTSTGKSAIITSIIKELIKSNPNIKVLTLAPTLSTVKNINDTFTREGIDSSVFGHPDKSIKSQVTTSLVQSLVSYSKKDENFLDNINAVFYDECLPSGSLILLPDGSKMSISRIYNNDNIQEVMSYNIDTNEYEIKKILRKYKTPYNNKFWKVYYKNPVSDKVEGVSLTPNHKVYTKNRGYVQASDLTTNDLIKIDFSFARMIKTLTSATFVKVVRVSPNVGSKSKYKYNLEVEDNHNYFASDVLVSNCHHLKCDTWSKLNKLLPNVEYSLGFSALSINKSEIYSRDISEMSYESSLIVGSSGPVIMHMDPSYYIEKGIIALPIVVRIITNISLPVGFDESVWTNLVSQGIMSTPRTNKVSQISAMFSTYGRKSMILVSRKDHAFSIAKFLVSNYRITNLGISFGSGVGYLYESVSSEGDVRFSQCDSLDILNKLSEGELSIVIGTSHIDEGVDLKNLDAIILAGGGKKDRRIVQRVGRVLRKTKTGKYAYIIDFTDSGSRVLSRQSRERFNMYKNIIGVPKENLYDKISVEDFECEFKKLEGLISK